MTLDDGPSSPDAGPRSPGKGLVAALRYTAFYVVMARTVRQLLGFRRTLVLLAAGQALALLLAQAAWKVYEEAVEVDSADRDE